MKSNLRLGRSGIQEGAALLSVVLVTGGLFAIDCDKLYSNGNTSYVSMPLAVIISLSLFLASCAVIDRSGARNMGEFLRISFGNLLYPPVALTSAIILIFAAYAPLSQFVRAMHGLFFEGVTYSKLILFIMPAVLALSLLGLETISRCSKIYSILLLALFLTVAAASAPQFRSYRLYPLPLYQPRETIVQTLRGIGVTLPAFFALLCVSDGYNSLRSTRKIGGYAAIISCVILLAAHLALSLTYNYRQLASQFMPLFRINYLDMFEAHLMRLDKIANMIWLNGAMLSGAFYIYAASRLVADSFLIRDIRPPVTCFALICSFLILFETESRNNSPFISVKEFLTDYGYMIILVPLLAAMMIAMIKRKEGRE